MIHLHGVVTLNYHALRYFKTQELPTFSPDGTKLSRRGRIIDTIATVAQALPMLKILPDTSTSAVSGIACPDQQTVKVFQEKIRCCESLTNYRIGETVQEAFRNAITQYSSMPGCMQPGHEPLPGTSQKEFTAWRAAVISGSLQRGEIESTLDESCARVFNEHVFKLQHGNAFFLTARGDMGLAEGIIKDGDLVAMICYMELPLILRPDGENFRLVTYAYLHGLMYGEENMGDNDEVEDLTLV